MDNMQIYNSVRSAPPEALRKIAAGRLKGKSDINPMWRIKKLTELFGTAGIGWKFDPPVFEEKQGANGEVVVHCFTCLYIRQGEEKPWSAPIPGVGGSLLIAREQGGLRTDDDAYKKAYTDAQSVACKALGVGADVYWEADPTKYSARSESVPAAPKRDPEVQAALDSTPMILTCACCGKPIQDAMYKGKRVSNTHIAKTTKEKYGRLLCWDCAQKQPKEEKGLEHA